MNGFKVEHKDESGQGVVEVQGLHEVVDGFSGMRGENKTLPDSPAWFPTSEKKLLGDWIHFFFALISLGFAHKIMNTVAKLQGKKECGCKKRRKKLNRFHAYLMQEKVQELVWRVEQELGAVIECRRLKLLEYHHKKFVDSLEREELAKLEENQKN